MLTMFQIETQKRIAEAMMANANDSRHAERDKQIRELEAKLIQLKVKAATAETLYLAAQQKIGELEEQLRKPTRQAEERGQQIVGLQKTIAEDFQKLAERDARIAQLEAELTEVRTENAACCSCERVELVSNLARVGNERDDLLDQLTKARQRIRDLEEQLRLLRERLIERDQDLLEVYGQLDERDARISATIELLRD